MAAQKNILESATTQLKQADNSSAELDARLLLAHVLDKNANDLLCLAGDFENEINETQATHFAQLLARRLEGEPVSRILGKRGFWSEEFNLAPDVFDPRPETELLVELATKNPAEKDDPLRVLDLGTGTGCILLSILKERPAWKGIGIDRSPHAVRLANKNMSALGLWGRAHFICTNWNIGFNGNFDLIVSNPPYIEEGAIAGLAREVKEFDPHLALSGGADGLCAYRQLASLAPALLKKNGCLLLELGEGQADAVQALFDASLWLPSLHKDLSGTNRVLSLEKQT